MRRRPVVGIYGAATNRIAGTAGAQNLVSIENPASSGKVVYVRLVKVGSMLTATANTNFQYRLGRTTATPTGGTTLTAQNTDAGTGVPSAVAIVRSGPTATAAAGQLWAGSGLAGSNNPNFGIIELFAWDSDDDDEDVRLEAGSSALLVSAEGNDADLNHTISFIWAEALT